MVQPNKRLAQPRPEGGFALRVFRRKGAEKKMPRLLLKCGCCDSRLEVFHDAQALEINGGIASVKNWREVLLPLLHPDQSAPPKPPHLDEGTMP